MHNESIQCFCVNHGKNIIIKKTQMKIVILHMHFLSQLVIFT